MTGAGVRRYTGGEKKCELGEGALGYSAAVEPLDVMRYSSGCSR